MLHSDTAERIPALREQQMNPPAQHPLNVEHLVTLTRTLEPLRQSLNLPPLVTSGYRSPAVNLLVGGTPTSQHLLGQAADLLAGPGETTQLLEEIDAAVRLQTGKPLRPGTAPDFLLFAWIALRLASKP